MLAFHNTTVSKPEVMNQLQEHFDNDQIVKGQYWKDGRGCGVGCTIHSGNHAEYEPRFGIPQMLARLEDCIFESLPDGVAKEWPLRFMRAVNPGSDLSLVGWKFLHWLLTDKTVNPGIDHPLVRDAIKKCADVLDPIAKGEQTARSAATAPSAESAESAAKSAARSAANAVSTAWSAATAAWSAASAESAVSAAWSAWRAASAWRPARSAESAARSADSAASAAWNAAWSATSAESAAKSAAATAAATAAWIQMGDKLIELIEAAPVTERE